MRTLLCCSIILLSLTTGILWASEVRVDSVGGLSLVLDDETVAINPFTFGDPAGLALLPPKNRLDATLDWFYENEMPDNFQRHYFGTVGEITSNTVNYNGLILFPTDRWAVQADGDYLYSEGLSTAGLEAQGVNRTRELLRTAYNFGPVAAGIELAPTQTTSPLAAQAIGSAQAVSGRDTETTSSLNGSLLVCFPSASPRGDRLEIGGGYSYQINAPLDTVGLSVIPSGSSTAFPVTATTTASKFQSFGPEVYFDSPGSMQAAVACRILNFSDSFDEVSPNSSLLLSSSPFTSNTGSLTDLVGALKNAFPLSGGLNLKTGAALEVLSSTQNSYDPNGATASTQTLEDWKAQAGVGVEQPGDYTVGIQASVENTNGSNLDGAGNNLGNTNFTAFTTALGGEKWLSPQWAFRVGIAYLNQFNGGDVPYTTFFLPNIDPGVRLETTTLTAGLGFKDTWFYTDLGFSYGQPVRDGSSAGAFAVQIGADWAAGILF